jgi:2-hydroxyglutarate dehydrogenase
MDGGDTAPRRCDLAVVGAGLLGLAAARELQRRHPSLSVCVLEREDHVAAHQSGHNSGVLHEGIYYPPGSLKARLCREGLEAMYRYCEDLGIAHERCGKLIVARSAAELPRLGELEARGRANRLRGLRRLGAHAIHEQEPHARGVAALHTSETGIVDYAAVTEALADDVRAGGGAVACGSGVTGVSTIARAVRLSHAGGELEAAHALFCAGLWADRLAVMAGARPDPRIVPFRGRYLRLRSDRRHLVRSLVYPVPDPALPFLGAHLTRTVSGQVLVGPTALVAPFRNPAALAWPGTWRMIRREWRAGAGELRRASRRALMAAVSRLVPELRPDDAESAWSGVRAQAVSRSGELLDDFAFAATERALHVRNAPSPGATSAFAIARHVAERAETAFGLGARRR